MREGMRAALDRLDAALGRIGVTLDYVTEVKAVSNWRRNVASLACIPTGLIDEAWRRELMERAERGEEVYAYTGHHGESVAPRWFVWDDHAEQPASSMYPGVRYALDELENGRPA